MTDVTTPSTALTDWAARHAEPKSLELLALQHVTNHLHEAALAASAAGVGLDEFLERAEMAWRNL